MQTWCPIVWVPVLPYGTVNCACCVNTTKIEIFTPSIFQSFFYTAYFKDDLHGLSILCQTTTYAHGFLVYVETKTLPPPLQILDFERCKS